MKLKSSPQIASNLSSNQLFEIVIKSFDLSEQIRLITEMLKYHSDANHKNRVTVPIRPLIENRIALPTVDGFEFVQVNEIIRIEGDSNYTWVHHVKKGKFIISKTLKEFEAKLSKFCFVRVHNSHLINVKFIEKYIKTDNSHLVMFDGSLIPISKRKRIEIQQLFS